MLDKKYKFITCVKYMDFSTWAVNNYFSSLSLMSKYPVIKLEKVIKPRKERIKPFDIDSNTPIVEKIRFSDGSLFFRKEKTPKNDLFKVYEEDLLVSNINFEKGAFAINSFGIILSSTDYQPYEIIYPINKVYFNLLLRSEKFLNIVKKKKPDGMKTRAKYDFIKQFSIPIPPITEQESLVSIYNTNIQLANEYEDKANSLEIQIDKVLFDELGIVFEKYSPTSKKILKIIDFATLETKWEISIYAQEIISAIKKGKYSTESIGSYYNLVTRSWNKKATKAIEFNYIEISSINQEYNIITPTTVPVAKAPSRATQTVKQGDLIIGLTRPYLKKFALITSKENNDVCSSAFQVIEENSKYDLEYLKFVLMSNIGIKQFEILMTGALYPAINQAQLSSMIIPLPPLHIQQKISTKINQMKTEIKEFRKKAQDLRNKAKQDFENEIFSNKTLEE